MNISFFIPNPYGTGIIADNAVIFAVTMLEYSQLSLHEKDFLLWYRNDFEKEGLQFLCVNWNNEALDMPQQEICRLFMEMIRTKTIPDPDIF